MFWGWCLRSHLCLFLFKNKKDTDDLLVKIKTKFFPDKNNNSELNTFFEKLWNINLKEKTRKNNL